MFLSIRTATSSLSHSTHIIHVDASSPGDNVIVRVFFVVGFVRCRIQDYEPSLT